MSKVTLDTFLGLLFIEMDLMNAKALRGMTSRQASKKKRDGHKVEHLYAQLIGGEVAKTA